MKKIRDVREFELYKKKVSIIDFYSVLISTPLGGVVIRKKFWPEFPNHYPSYPTRGG